MDQTAKHNPRIDEAMASDVSSLTHGAPVESRAQEARLQEDPGVDGGQRRDPDDPVGLGISQTDADQRAQLALHLAAVPFPSGPDRLASAAEADHAPPDVVAALRKLPAERRYENAQAVWEALGGDTEDRHT